MRRNIVSPDIINQRFSKAQSNDIWFFIDYINKQLRNNPIHKDGSICIEAPYIIAETMLDQIKEIFYSVGWKTIDVTFEYNDDDVDYTKAIFRP